MTPAPPVAAPQAPAAPAPQPVAAPAPRPATKRTVGPWSTAAARDSQVAGLLARGVPVRKWSGGAKKFYADIWD